MRIEARDGRTVADTAAVAAVTSRPTTTIRAICPRGEHGYDLDHAVQQLEETPHDPIVLTIPEAARYLGIPSGRLYVRVHRGRLRPVGTRGRSDLYTLDALTSTNTNTGDSNVIV